MQVQVRLSSPQLHLCNSLDLILGGTRYGDSLFDVLILVLY